MNDRWKQALLGLFRSSPVQFLAAKLGRDLCPNKWVFVMGCYNSGTTLLSRVLAAHPQCTGMPREGVFLTDALPFPEEHGWVRMWRECEEELSLGEDRAALARRVKRHWSWWIDPGKDVLVEKSVSNLPRADFFLEYFTPAFFVFIIRDGRAVAEGIRRKARPAAWGNPRYHSQYPIDLCASQWVRCVEVMENALPTLGDRSIVLRYEDLSSDPAKTLNEIFDRLGLQPLGTHFEQVRWAVHGNEARISNMNAESISRLEPEELNAVESICGDHLQRYGYQVPYPFDAP